MELILEEFVTATTEHVDPDDTNAMDGWVAMEDTEFVQEVIRIEVEELLDEGLVDDVKVDDEDGKVDSDDEDDNVEMVEEEEVVTIETINDLCAQLHQMSAKVQKFKCDGDEFSGVASKFSDLSSTLRLSHKRLESNRVANKQKKAPRQGTLFPFINVRGGSK
jgi:hypothetical protein